MNKHPLHKSSLGASGGSSPLWGVGGLLLIGVAIYYIFNIFLIGNNLKFDEFYSIAMLDYSYSDICRITAEDVHPPLFYLLLKVYSSFFSFSPEHLYFYRFLTVAFYLGMLALCLIPVRRLFGKRLALVSFLVLAFLPVGFYMYAYVRMYSLAAFLLFGSAVYAVDAYRNNSRWAWAKLIFFTLGAMYTHYYALMGAFFIILALLIAIIARYIKDKEQAKLIRALLCGAILCILYIPWLVSLFGQLGQVGGGYWISTITLADIAYGVQYYFSPKNIDDSYADFFSSSWCLVLTFALTALCCLVPLIYMLRKKTENTYIAFIALIIVGLCFLFVLVYSFIATPVYYARYLSCYIGLFALGMSLLLNEFIGEKTFLAKSVLISFCTLMISLSAIELYINLRKGTLFHKEEKADPFDEFMADTNGIVYTEGVLSPNLGVMSLLKPQYKYLIVIKEEKPHNDPALFNYIRDGKISFRPFVHLQPVKEPVSNERSVYFTTHPESFSKFIGDDFVITDHLEGTYYYKFERRTR
ncbi:glycosyltransferase family 39 protein [Dysgonomonas sp. 511]|uniref:glycosyltransferase family 39 protein n=1 Tax=Dysgonomonas sp. 511 TaxID=2302930 RepID=UPI0013D52782|nr:glycosyltransferase family 39 protein [Dysgonomonas sp. 511]NDV78127.1 hypothetical protein [Dysgonomonas sp. 511]